MSLSDKIAKDHAFGGTISYVGEWHEELLRFVRNQVGRITWKIHEVNIAWMRFDNVCLYYAYVVLWIGNDKGYIG